MRQRSWRTNTRSGPWRSSGAAQRWTDGAGGKLGPITEAGCWAHGRRKLFDLAQLAGAPLAAKAVRRIDALFDVERTINGLPAEQRLLVREDQVLPLVVKLESWMRGARARMSRHPEHRIYRTLLRDLVVDRPNQVWCADLTYIPMRRGFLYLVAVTDWSTRKVLAWRVSNTMDTAFCVETLQEALARFGRPEVFSADQGGAAQSSACVRAL